MSVNRHDYASDDFIHTIDGDVITRSRSRRRISAQVSDPDRRVHQMRYVGLGVHGCSTTRIPDDRIASAFALASIITGINFSRNVLDMTLRRRPRSNDPLLAIHMAGGKQGSI